jgi:adenine/guanine/hypoxanthine permease
MDAGAVFVATCPAVASTFVMGLLIVMALDVRFGLTKFSGTVSLPPSIAPTLFKLDSSRLFDLTLVIVIFSILFLDLFGNVGP